MAIEGSDSDPPNGLKSSAIPHSIGGRFDILESMDVPYRELYSCDSVQGEKFVCLKRRVHVKPVYPGAGNQPVLFVLAPWWIMGPIAVARS